MTPSPITGATGNQEFFLHLHRLGADDLHRRLVHVLSVTLLIR